MSKISNLTKYREAINLEKDLRGLNVALMKLGTELFPYADKYVPARNILRNIIDYQTIVEIHLNAAKRVIESKGEE